MNKKIIIIILVVAIIFTASYFYIKDRSKTVAINNIDTILINNVVELEKNLVLAQFHKISFEDFKDKNNSFIHPYYSNEYFEVLEKDYNNNIMMTALTNAPFSEYISRVYTSEDGANKFIFVKIAEEGIGNIAAVRYTFIKDEKDGEWKIRNSESYVLSLDMKKPIKDVETFTNFNGMQIEYELTKILDNL